MEIPVVIAGDFNEDPGNLPITQLQGSMTDLWKIANADEKSWPPFTTFKYRDGPGYLKHTIDYIFLMRNSACPESEANVAVTEYLDP